MRQLICLGIICLLFSTALGGQTSSDSINSLLKKARYFELSDHDSSLYYYNILKDLAERDANDTLLAIAAYRTAGIYAALGEHDLARDLYLDFIESYEDSGYDDKLMSAYARIGIIFRAKGQFDSAMYWFRVLERFEDNTDELPGQISAYGFIGSVYEHMGNYKEAEAYYLKEKERAFARDDHIARTIALYNLVLLYKNTHDLEKFGNYLQQYRELMDFNRFDERTLSVHLEGLFADAEGNISIDTLKNLIAGLERLNFPENLVIAYSLLGDQYLKASRYEDAIQALQKGLAIADSTGFEGSKLLAMSKLATAFEQSGQLKKALKTQKDLQQLIVDLNNEDSRKMIEELEVKYATEQKEKELLQQQIEVRKKTGQRNLVFSTSLILFLLGGLGTYNLWIRNKKNQQIATQFAQIQQQKIKALEKENKILAMDAMINGQEEERKRISKDLHDGLGGILSTVKLSFESIQKEIDRLNAFQPYEKAIKMLDDACEEVRRISHDMMPGALSVGGLPDAINDMAESLQQVHGIQADVQIIGMDKRMGENKEIMIYRIAQELVMNVIKHAEATKVIIQLSRYDSEVMLTVEDNGKGFDQSAETDGIGLKSIKSRVEYLNGELDINTTEGEGTMVSIRVPVTG